MGRETSSYLEEVLRRDRILVLLGLSLVTLLSWIYLFVDAVRMSKAHTSGGAMGMATPQMQAWGFPEFLMLFVMWAVMMVAMMVPSVSPTVLLFARFQRERNKLDRPFVPTGIFLGGYLAAWTVFSLVAAWGQWGLHAAALLSAQAVEPQRTSPFATEPIGPSSSRMIKTSAKYPKGRRSWRPLHTP